MEEKPQTLIIPYQYHKIHIQNSKFWPVKQPPKPIPWINTKYRHSLPYTRIKAYPKTHIYKVKALLLPEELAKQNTRLNLCMLQESVEYNLHLDMSFSQGFWLAKRATLTHIHWKAAKLGSRKQVTWPNLKEEWGNWNQRWMDSTEQNTEGRHLDLEPELEVHKWLHNSINEFFASGMNLINIMMHIIKLYWAQ